MRATTYNGLQLPNDININHPHLETP
jgi:hypothetical protein